MSPPDLVSRVLYRDGLVLVIDKPAGIPVHAGPGGGDNLEAGFDALRFGLPHPPALAHRLDRDTSGCLALGRTPKALTRMGKLFAGGYVRKTYWAITDGVPAEPGGVIDLPLLKIVQPGSWTIVPHPDGQPAVSEYAVRGEDGRGHAWLELRPRTGRTHQLRVHSAAIGCPMIGEPYYGPERRAPGNLHLLARSIAFRMEPGCPDIAALAPPPPHMRDALLACGWDGRTERAGGTGGGDGMLKSVGASAIHDRGRTRFAAKGR